MSTHIRHIEDASGDLVDVLHFCSAGCYADAGARGLYSEENGDGGANPGGTPDAEDESYVYCAECGVRMNGPDTPVVVNLLGREYGPDGRALPVPDPVTIEARAREAGAEHGRAAASWYFDGNTDAETYRRVLAGLEDGDPEVLDALPSSPLSGEYADEPTPASVLADLDVDQDDDCADEYLSAYEEGFAEASAHAIEAEARKFLAPSDTAAALDMDARYRVDGYGAVAWTLRTLDGGDRVTAVMVGDDEPHSLDAQDLHELEEGAYCEECGQLGCKGDGR